MFQAIILTMRRIMFISLLFIFCIGGAWYWFGTGTTPTATRAYTRVGQGDVYVALGDSLAAGFTVSKPEDAYVARIAAALRKSKSITVRNFAVPGETSTSILRRQLPAALSYIREQQRLGNRVSPITMDIGGNDAQAVRNASLQQRQQTIETIEVNIGHALDQLLDATRSDDGRPTADIAIMTYYNPYPGNVNDRTAHAYWSAQLNSAIHRAASARGVAVADVADAFEGGKVYRYTYIASGDIHANSDGHGLIAEQFLEALGY